MRFVQGSVGDNGDQEFIEANAVIQIKSAELLQFLLQKVVYFFCVLCNCLAP